MKILVTGGAGYLGSQLLPKLLLRGHKVRVLDVGYFGLGHLRTMRPDPQVIREDLCRINHDAAFLDHILKDIDCVIHLAAMSNDPTADLDPRLTEEINTDTTVTLAKACQEKNIKFLFSSTCSVYGGAGGMMTETSEVGPLTTYAISKAKAEIALNALCTKTWKPLILRYGTLFGYSPRMRFDLVVNIFSLFSVQANEIKVFGGGNHWRPFLHVSDCARALTYFAEKATTKHNVINISHENLRVVDLSDIFQRLNPNLKVNKVEVESPDQRDYRVTNQRMLDEGFKTKIDVEIGAQEIQEALVYGVIADPQSVLYQNVKWLKELGLKPATVPSVNRVA